MRIPAFRKKKQNKLACVCISIVVAMLLLVVAIDGMRLSDKHKKYLEREDELRSAIAAEEKRTEELKEFEKYTKTKRYAEEIAEEKLGLVHDDGIVFKPDDTE